MNAKGNLCVCGGGGNPKTVYAIEFYAFHEYTYETHRKQQHKLSIHTIRYILTIPPQHNHMLGIQICVLVCMISHNPNRFWISSSISVNTKSPLKWGIIIAADNQVVIKIQILLGKYSFALSLPLFL